MVKISLIHFKVHFCIYRKNEKSNHRILRIDFLKDQNSISNIPRNVSLVFMYHRCSSFSYLILETSELCWYTHSPLRAQAFRITLFPTKIKGSLAIICTMSYEKLQYVNLDLKI